MSKPDGILAVWGYSLLNVNPEIDPIIHHFYTQIIGPYWDQERKLIDEQYKTIPFPFPEIQVPRFEFSFEWSLDHFQGYISTWSSVQKYIKEKEINPVDELIAQLKPYWIKELKVTFPLFLRLGKCINLHSA